MRKSAVLLAIAGLSIAATAQGEIIYGITGSLAGGSLFNFDSATPGSTTVIDDFSLVVGSQLLPGHGVRGIDFRPANGVLYALSTNSSNFNEHQLYTVNLATAALTRVGTTFLTTGVATSRVSIDFNPVADRLRVVTGTDQNYRVNPNTGALVLQDTNLAWAVGDPFDGQNIAAVDVAYANNVAGALTTIEYVWDFNSDVLGQLPNGTFNGGQVNLVGGPLDFITNDGGVGLDISGASGIAYFSYNSSVTNLETFATLNLATGVPTTVGSFNLDVLDISVFIPSPSAAALLGLGGLAAARRRRA